MKCKAEWIAGGMWGDSIAGDGAADIPDRARSRHAVTRVRGGYWTRARRDALGPELNGGGQRMRTRILEGQAGC